MENTKIMTYGEELVGKNFNPSGLVSVDEAKHHYACVIDLLAKFHTPTPQNNRVNTKNRLLKIAEEKAIEAQMWAVKALTYGEN